MIYTITLNPSIDYIIHVNDFKAGELNRSTEDYINVGGKGIMVSKLLSNIGTENIAMGFLGGFTGDYIRQWFDQNQLQHDFVNVSQNSRINVKLKSNLESEINGQGPYISKTEQALFLNKLEQLKAGDTLIISGSSVPGADSDIIRQMIDLCRQKKVDFVIDTTGDVLQESICQKPLLIKPNLDELGEIFGHKITSTEEAILYGKRCLEWGAKYVIVSMGGKGALFLETNSVYYAAPVSGKLVNSVGAGDSMIAGFISHIKQEQSPLSSFQFAVAAGTATAFCEDIATHEEIKTIYPEVRISRLY